MGEVSVDACAICGYLSEISRSYQANPLTIKLFLAEFRFVFRHFPATRAGSFAGAFLFAFLNGCAVQEATKVPTVVVPVVVVPPKPAALSVEADATLKAAEQSVTEARIRRALWTAAVDELERARIAAKGFDSDATLRHAREVIALCGLSIAQLSAPPVKW
jgi:hypothetical protein